MEFTSSLNCFTTNLWFNSFAWQKREGGRESTLSKHLQKYIYAIRHPNRPEDSLCQCIAWKIQSRLHGQKS